MSVVSSADPRLQAAIRSSIRALRQVVDYRLPAALNLRLLELGENKEFLAPAEHDQLMALVTFAQERTAEKLQAELALRQLKSVFPEEVLA